jgi:hypothetical protein
MFAVAASAPQFHREPLTDPDVNLRIEAFKNIPVAREQAVRHVQGLPFYRRMYRTVIAGLFARQSATKNSEDFIERFSARMKTLSANIP